MPRNHEFFLTFLIKVALFAFPFMALELAFTHFTSFGAATGGAAFLASLIGVSLDHLLLRSEPIVPDPLVSNDSPLVAEEAAPEVVEPEAEKVPAMDIESSPVMEACRIDLAELSAALARAEGQLMSMEKENGDLRLQLMESESKLQAGSEAPFPVCDDVLELGYHSAVDDFKRRILTRSIALTNGNRAEAARQLGLQRTYLYRLVKQFQVKA